MSESLSFKLELEQQSDYEFRVKFDWAGVDELLLDSLSRSDIRPGRTRPG